MSLNNSLCLSSDSLKRQSFSERICDDLCEVIFQYLSLEDKLRLECVSKKFRRTIFQKQFELKIRTKNESIENLLLKNSIFDLKALEALLKKCPNITSIELKYHFFEFIDNNYNQFIHLITKYCDNLVEFKAPLTEMSENTFNKQFLPKFGSKLKALKLIEKTTELNRLTDFWGLEEMNFEVEKFGSDPTSVRVINESLIRVKFYNLKTLRVSGLGYFIDYISGLRTLRYLSLPLRYNSFKPTLMERTMNLISNQKDLTHFKVKTYLTDKIPFAESLRQMADNCPKLKSIDCTFELEKYFTSQNKWEDGLENQLLAPFKRFKQLKRLKLNFKLSRLKEEEDTPRSFSFEAFADFPNITHLCLKFNDSFIESIDEKVLKNIDIYFPSLQSLDISLVLKTTAEGTTQLSDTLSQLSRLEYINLRVSSDSIGEQLSKELGEKCKRIRAIDVKTCIAKV